MKTIPFEIFRAGWKKIAWITLFMVLYTSHTNLLTHFYLGHEHGVDHIIDFLPKYNFRRIMITTIVFATVGGIFFGGLEVFYFSRVLKRLSYASSMAIKWLVYLVLALLAAFTSSIFYHSFLRESRLLILT